MSDKKIKTTERIQTTEKIKITLEITDKKKIEEIKELNKKNIPYQISGDFIGTDQKDIEIIPETKKDNFFQKKSLADQGTFDFDKITERAKKVDPIPLLPGLHQEMPYILPYKLTKNDLLEDTTTATGQLLRYSKEYKTGKNKTKTVFWTTFIPNDVEKEGIPTFGDSAKSAYIAPHALAIAQGTPSKAIFRSKDLLSVVGYPNKRIKGGGKIFPALTNIYRTFAYLTIEVVDKEKGMVVRRELGPLFDKIIIDEKNKWFGVEFTNDTESLLTKYLNNELKPGAGTQFIGYSPKQLTLFKDKDLDLYDKNFDIWAVGKQGLKKRHYPLLVMTLAKKVFVFPNSYYTKHRTEKAILKDIRKRLEKATGRSIGNFKVLDSKKKVGRKIDLDFVIEKTPMERIQDIGIRGPARCLARKITEHCIKSFDKIRKSPADFEEQLYNTIVLRDLKACEAVFDEFKTGGFNTDNDCRQHPGDLFKNLKALQKIRRKRDIINNFISGKTGRE